MPGRAVRALRRNLDLLAAFLLPAAVYTAILADRGIYPFDPRGKYTVLTSDMDNQYSQYYAYFDSALRGHGSLLFTWRADLGMNYWPSIAYYLTSPFGLVTLFSSDRRLPIFLAVVTILKIGTAGLCMALLLRRLRRRESESETPRGTRAMGVVLATAYALAAWTLVYAFNIMWLDAMFLLPLALLGVEKLLENGRIAALAVGVGLSLTIDFYTGAMVCVFTCMYALARYFGYRAVFDRRDFLRTAVRFLAAGALGGLLSAAFTIPTYLGGLTQKTKLVAESTISPPVPVLSVLIRFLGGTDDRGFQSPNLAAGTLVLLLVPAFFSIKRIRRAERIAFGAVLAFLLAATEVKPLYLVMHGGQMPNGFPFRFAFLIAALLVILAFRAWLSAESVKQVYTVLASGVVWLGVLYVGRRKYPRILPGDVTRFDALVLVLGTVLIATAMWLRVRDKDRALPRAVPRRLAVPGAAASVAVAMVSVLALDAIGSAFFIGKKELGVAGTSVSWAQWYSRPSTSYGTALSTYTPEPDEFYRTEGYDQNVRSSNDGLRYGNFAQTHFSSLGSGVLHQTEGALGFAHHDAYIWASHVGATLLTDGLFGFKYLVTTTRTDPAAVTDRLGLTLVRTYDDTKPGGTPDITKVWRIDDALPVGFRVPAADLAGFTAAPAKGDPYAAQERIFGVPGAFQPLCTAPVVAGAGLQGRTNADGSLSVVSAPGGGVRQGSITWTCTASGLREAYIYAPEGLGNDATYVHVEGAARPAGAATADPAVLRYPYGFSNGFQDLGGVEAGTFRITMESAKIPAGRTMTIMPNAVRGLDPAAADAALAPLAAGGVTDVHWTDRGLSMKTSGGQASTVFLSVPRILGWSVKVDGKKVATTSLVGAFTGVPVGPGTHTIAMEFTPPGLFLGIAASLVGLLLLIGVWLMQRVRQEPEFAERVRTLGASTVARYVFVGGLAFVTDIGVLWLGHGAAGLPVWLATALAYAAAWVVNFGLNRILTFAEYGARDGEVRKQSIRFTALVLINLVVTELLMAGLIHLGIGYLVAKVLSTVFITLYNFVVYKRWVFASEKQGPDDPGPREEPDPAEIFVP